jgi:hypothetical protein
MAPGMVKQRNEGGEGVKRREKLSRSAEVAILEGLEGMSCEADVGEVGIDRHPIGPALPRRSLPVPPPPSHRQSIAVYLQRPSPKIVVAEHPECKPMSDEEPHQATNGLAGQ